MEICTNLHAFLWQSMSANNCNTYFIDGPTRVLIDPGHQAMFDHVETGLRQLGLGIDDIDLVICTHAHPDHLEAAQLVKQNGKAIFSLHETEWHWMKDIGKHMSAGAGIDVDRFMPDFFLNEGDLSINGLEMQIYHTPGHSPGSISLYWPIQKALFTGDLIFKDGIGRTDLPGGDSALIKESIKSLSKMEVELLLSGHGEMVSGLMQVQQNFESVENVWFNYI